MQTRVLMSTALILKLSCNALFVYGYAFWSVNTSCDVKRTLFL